MRGLQGGAFKVDAPKFEAMASASLQLGRVYMQLSQQAPPAPAAAAATAATASATVSLRDLAAARMHLRGVLKQCEPVFAGAPLYVELQDMLGQVERMEAAARASVA